MGAYKVHFPHWREILSVARAHGLFVIEDCAHAHGASVDGFPAVSLGDVGCFSFYPTKVLTCGTGGMLVTNDDAMARSARGDAYVRARERDRSCN
ncbi:MAG: DegT/DnrJ/EryC1/StrS family aminotransferase [Betaproteobacteria bacterium]|uniref:DegT/DnrJ/EryC1/StrS family aminotransferase n=1 Tax=Candidatus Proximibacter danicus TaxID=2954365 RepID=A0A9D7K217_9PROT|nr:DegT/DnrJ/EryC1/StrS family aminotransferase [Candidatus Proximibacter danicus]